MINQLAQKSVSRACLARSRINWRLFPSAVGKRYLSSTVSSSSSTTAMASASSFQLPAPSWSLQDLELSKQHAPVSDAELKTLAKRACLDLNQFDDTTRQQLRQDLGNMMHMIEQVSSFEFDKEGAPQFSEADIYDKPRGVMAAPLRRDDDKDDNCGRREQVELQAQRVFERFLQPQTTKVGAHNYFSIETKREDTTRKD